MKALFCNNCKDLIALFAEKRKCKCKQSEGYVLDGVTHYKGDHAVPMRFKPEWFGKESKGLDATAQAMQPGKRPVPKNSDADREFCTKVIEYLNQKAGTAFSTQFPSAHTDLILAREKEHNIGLEEFVRVIDNKVAQWLKKPEMAQYLTPSTLFGKQKFITYLGEKHVTTESTAGSTFDRFTSTVNRAAGSAANSNTTGG